MATLLSTTARRLTRMEAGRDLVISLTSLPPCSDPDSSSPPGEAPLVTLQGGPPKATLWGLPGGTKLGEAEGNYGDSSGSVFAYTAGDGSPRIAASGFGYPHAAEVLDGTTLDSLRRITDQQFRAIVSTEFYTEHKTPRAAVVYGGYTAVPVVWPPPPGPDPLLVIFDLESGETVQRLSANGAGGFSATCVAVLPPITSGGDDDDDDDDEALLAMGTSSGSVHVWGGRRGRKVARLSRISAEEEDRAMAGARLALLGPIPTPEPSVLRAVTALAASRATDGSPRITVGYTDGAIVVYTLPATGEGEGEGEGGGAPLLEVAGPEGQGQEITSLVCYTSHAGDRILASSGVENVVGWVRSLTMTWCGIHKGCALTAM
jgi:hypothetical protein